MVWSMTPKLASHEKPSTLCGPALLPQYWFCLSMAGLLPSRARGCVQNTNNWCLSIQRQQEWLRHRSKVLKRPSHSHLALYPSVTECAVTCEFKQGCLVTQLPISLEWLCQSATLHPWMWPDYLHSEHLFGKTLSWLTVTPTNSDSLWELNLLPF
jgi:hypothetical protein